MLVVTERDESIASHRTRKPEPSRTFAHPNALHATTLRVVIPGAKMLLKVALSVGEIGLRFRREHARKSAGQLFRCCSRHGAENECSDGKTVLV